ncbi:MAG TPA: T9SS type A sorting domain-containing protein, partial [Bacteroidia bacterium]|nr:T9SS type A sorting domain-containing protein [Bacteroidia bacterium]
GKLYISNFDATQKNVDIEVTDITGKLITKQQNTAVSNNLVELNLDVNNGVYFVKVVSANGNTQVQKVIINK